MVLTVGFLNCWPNLHSDPLSSSHLYAVFDQVASAKVNGTFALIKT